MPRQKAKTTKKTKTPLKKTKPIKKTQNKSAKKITSKKSQQKENFQQSISERLRLDESYASLILGALVVVFLIVFLMAVLGSRKAVSEIQERLSPTPNPTAAPVAQKTYILQDGEGLWDVAVKFYGDGEKWVVIQQANNFPDPDNVEPGTKIIIP